MDKENLYYVKRCLEKGHYEGMEMCILLAQEGTIKQIFHIFDDTRINFIIETINEGLHVLGYNYKFSVSSVKGKFREDFFIEIVYSSSDIFELSLLKKIYKKQVSSVIYNHYVDNFVRNIINVTRNSIETCGLKPLNVERTRRFFEKSCLENKYVLKDLDCKENEAFAV